MAIPQFIDLLNQREASWEHPKRAILLDRMLAIGTFDEIASLYEKTFNNVHDRELTFQAMLEKGSIEQLKQLNKLTYNPAEKERIEASIDIITYSQFLSSRNSSQNKGGSSITKAYHVFYCTCVRR
jgi:hypothetical protein